MNLFTSFVTALYTSLYHAPKALYNMSQQESSAQEGVVIIGGGIIGLSTAYSIAHDMQKAVQCSTQQPYRPVPKITLVESSDRLCPAASSQATGGIGDYGFGPDKTAGKSGVGWLSYKMHVEMAAKHNGEELYGFSQQV